MRPRHRRVKSPFSSVSDSTKKANRLINETSPYLLQHAYNPVDWYPWNKEALDRAQAEGKLILLSIGYSACHWCHVMEHESFEDEEIAQKMNSQFVCVKVDREERPDLDKIYQLAHQMFNQRGGGWPLTVFLTPDEHTPVFVGTYFPKTPRMGMPGFGQLLDNIAKNYMDNREKIPEHSKAIKEAFQRLGAISEPSGDSHLEGVLDNAILELERQYDPVYGGFGDAPKFPHSTQFDLLLRFCLRPDAENIRVRSVMRKAVHSLEAMSEGGLYDQLAGGFYRYSVDARWEIPHFEKMLYDSALLMPIYVDFGFAADREDFHDVAIDTAGWVVQEMQSPAGGYYSSLDADSEGEEGKYYAWDLDELRNILTESEFRIAEIRFGLRGTPNFEGKWHLRIENSTETVAKRLGERPEGIEDALLRVKEKLLKARAKRVKPGLDDKILTSWNGLMIKAMARTGRLLDRPDFVDSAERAVDFIRDRMWKDGRLLAAARKEKAHLNAYLDDYVFLADGVFELLQARWRDVDMYFMTDLINAMVTNFRDENSGAMYFTSHDHENLIHRSIPTHDDATPSGNGVASHFLMKVGHILSEPKYTEIARGIIGALQGGVVRMPSAYGSLVCAIEETLAPPTTVLIQGKQDCLESWLGSAIESSPLDMAVFAIPDNAVAAPGSLQGIERNGDAVALLCSEYTCSPPIESLGALLSKLPCKRLVYPV